MELNKIYNEDCLDTMSRMPDDFIDLTVTSPPYNMRNRVRNGKYTTKEVANNFSKKYDHFSDDLPIDEYYNFHHTVLGELLRVSKVIVWNVAIVTGNKLAVFKLIGAFSESIKDIAILDKGNGEPAMHPNVLNRATELILILEPNATDGRAFSKSYFKRGALGDIWRCGRDNHVNGLSACMPDKLATIAINSFSQEGDLVYDPFMGSGTTAKIAHLLKRNWIGSEISEEYVEMAKKRLQPHIDQKQLF